MLQKQVQQCSEQRARMQRTAIFASQTGSMNRKWPSHLTPPAKHTSSFLPFLKALKVPQQEYTCHHHHAFLPYAGYDVLSLISGSQTSFCHIAANLEGSCEASHSRFPRKSKLTQQALINQESLQEGRLQL